MPSVARFGVHALATAFGFLMVGLAAAGTHGPALAAGIAAVVTVGAGMVFRPAATVAVLLSVTTIVMSEPPYIYIGLSGLCAAAYLICRHAAGMPDAAVMASWPTIIAAVGFTFVGVVAMSFPLHLPWVPLAAPLAVLAIYVLATRPFLG
ncbi:hypothetical protein [Mycobacterium montefiorense]|uniref:Integral membrane protein n=1 Tax=Mycobacterium montefiorense TaxID=154654 RepID=A0AA37PS43_9MYCO|nr:hypothetical protein [Mycobacterium montefiorense]GBG36665.1 integral membrane protein [Mycobacterium montefiorense]GKU37015.1 integral membrane protein [Mycobacterium montefiorense]GKU43080.1 integral membrane protein [Mycobacterium montefiorense]GKU48609.1 integral membrane protein [Mycobacterium montefiorense]GKU50639.1 integral membrane protein [Mycobacterium montefiorense]